MNRFTVATIKLTLNIQGGMFGAAVVGPSRSVISKAYPCPRAQQYGAKGRRLAAAHSLRAERGAS